MAYDGAIARRARSWTAEQDAMLRRLRKDGYSFGVIASKLKKSRNACIGRANRIGVPSLTRPAYNVRLDTVAFRARLIDRSKTNPTKPRYWTDEDVRLLVAVHRRGGSRAEAAEILKRTIPAVTEKAYKMGLRWSKARSGKRPPVKPNRHGPAPESRQLVITDLAPNECRYATHYDDGTHRFCGHPTEPGRSYCAYHASRVYQPAQKKGAQTGRPEAVTASPDPALTTSHLQEAET